MLYEPTNTPAMARTSNLNEELGQVVLPNLKKAICVQLCLIVLGNFDIIYSLVTPFPQ